MKQVSLTVDDATFLSAERKAQKAGKSLPALLLEFLARFSAKDDDFDLLEREERALREKLRVKGRQFAAADRIGRAELHDRNALR